MSDLASTFGQIDIYLFDQVLRGRIAPGMRVFDAGCGFGRNLVYLLRAGYDVYGADTDAAAVASVRHLASTLAPRLDGRNFRVEPIEALSFPDSWADVVISSAVLHFARDAAHFDAMLRGTWRVVRPGGLFFARLASSVGIEGQIAFRGRGRYFLPDGTERFLVDEDTLLETTRSLGGELADPLKTTLVHGQRSMTTWVMWKRLPRG